MVSTSNGQNEGHTRVPSPRAPSLIAVNKHSGEVVWRAIGAGEQVLHGQWSSPVAADVNGRIQVLFGGGDGWLRAYDAASGHEVWRFDGNPKDARWLPRPGVLSRSSIIASPVFADGRVFIAMGQSPGHGNGPSFDSCDQSQRPGRRHREQAPLDVSRGRPRGGNAHREGRSAVRRGPGRNGSLPGRGNRRPRLEARDERGHLGMPPAGRRPPLRRERRRQHDRSSCRTAKGSAGADRDGCAALFASGAGRRCALSGHRAAGCTSSRQSLDPKEVVERAPHVSRGFHEREMPAVPEHDVPATGNGPCDVLADLHRDEVVVPGNDQSRNAQAAKPGQQVVAGRLPGVAV